MSASIKDVAVRAGVSTSTVSRVLNGTARVDAKKADRVRQAVDYYQYEPNRFGRGLVKQSAEMVGIYFYHPEHTLLDTEYGLELLRGAQQALQNADMGLVLLGEATGYPGVAQQPPSFYQAIRKKRIDGLLLAMYSPPIMEDPRFMTLLNSGYPVSYIGKAVCSTSIHVDAQFERYHIRMLEILYQAGHRRVLLLCHREHQIYLDAVRCQARKRFRQMELYSVEARSFIQSNVAQEQLRHCTKELGCTAVICPEMQSARMVLGGLTELGLTVPDQISVLTVEHRRGEGGESYPPLSAIYVPAFAMSECAAEQLLKQIRGEPVARPHALWETEYISRRSVACPPKHSSKLSVI